MSPQALYGAAIGALLAAGIGLMIAGWRGHTIHLSRSRRRSGRFSAADRRRTLLAVTLAVVVGLITRWPVAAIGTGAAIWVWPKMFGGAKVGAHELERLEALATWTESLRDTIAGAISLEQAIPASLDAAPPLLREPLGHLVGMLRTRVPLPEALTRFADDLDDASADLVVAALILNARLRGPGLEATLSELAIHAREELEHRQLVEAGRKSLHRSARVIVGVTLAFSIGLVLFSRQYVEPYSTPLGQVVLAGVIAIFAFALMRLRKLAEYTAPQRFLSHQAEAIQQLGAR